MSSTKKWSDEDFRDFFSLYRNVAEGSNLTEKLLKIEELIDKGGFDTIGDDFTPFGPSLTSMMADNCLKGENSPIEFGPITLTYEQGCKLIAYMFGENSTTDNWPSLPFRRSAEINFMAGAISALLWMQEYPNDMPAFLRKHGETCREEKDE